MIVLHYVATSNGLKIMIALEEMGSIRRRRIIHCSRRAI